jgi:hypothetical protein
MNTSLRNASRWWGVILIALGGLLAGAAAWADPPGRVGRIADTEGTAWLWDDEQAEWVQAQRNWPVTQGDRISVERGSRTSVQVGSATLRLDGGTDAEFTQLDDERVRVRLHGGTVALRARGGDSAREFAVITDEGRFEPLRAGRYRIDVSDNNDGSFGTVWQGALRFEARDSVLDLQAGQRAEFWSERGATHYAWAQMPDDRFSDWVAREDREDDRERNRYVSPEMTGAEDLDRYGRWDRHPEYGAVWYPSAVSVGWAPYRYGRWAYVGPWGWTWIDDAPWGFAPFHYGRWVSWHGRWGWVPGQYVARPVYAPALVAWFGGSNISVSIGIGPSVGWVPLAPREVYYPTYQVTNVYVRNVNGPYRHWHGPDVRYEPRPPSRPIMYTNQGVAGGVTVVPQGVMRERRPVANAVVAVDPRTVKSWTSTQPAVNRVPVEPPSRANGARPAVTAVPAPPGAVRAAPWSPPGRSARGSGDGGEERGRAARPQGRDDNVVRSPQQPARGNNDDARGGGREAPRAAPNTGRPDAVATPPQRPATVAPPSPAPQRRDDNERAVPRGNGGRDDDRRERGVSRPTAPEPVRPAAQPVAPAVPPAPPAAVGRPPQGAQPPQGGPPKVAPQQGQRGRSRDDAAPQAGDRPGRGDDAREERGNGRREQQNR